MKTCSFNDIIHFQTYHVTNVFAQVIPTVTREQVIE